ncbi:hypothetical protein FQN55_005509 [Onygenales sp. PD_40]|nr:hypothetical protein FQN55_005509 [Onygenales sp. PD_40]KAK2800181.1 hypothetical protein FQN51_006257 [Onygenales sp. PD_10]
MADSNPSSVATESGMSQPPEVDDQLPKTSAEYCDNISIYTGSLSAEARKYPEENGRRYHAYQEGRYLLPNDEKENDRLDIHHALFMTVMDNNLFLAPLKDPKSALDLCTGSGIWAVEFGKVTGAENRYVPGLRSDWQRPKPNATVAGRVPPNLQFIVDDVESEWVYEDTPFDFIHARYLAEAIRDMPRLIKQAFSCVKPGGWVEFQDWDTHPYSMDNSHQGTAIRYFFDVVLEAFAKQGYITNPGGNLERIFKEAGFINVHVKKYRKRVGAYNILQFDEAIEGGAMAVLTRHEKWKPEEVQVLIAKARADARRPDIHILFDM